METHEYADFMRSVKENMASEYKRLRRRVSEDPSTAGDQAEESWAEFLRNWLPANYPVVTKGRILNSAGTTSPQVDVLVLHPCYPLHLRNKKHYFAGGVIAAFECKLTLETKHLRGLFQNSLAIKKMLSPRQGTPYDEIFQLPIYGLLAHSSKTKDISHALHKCILKYCCQHPRELPDFVCIADSAIYKCSKSVHIGPYSSEEGRDEFKEFDKGGGIISDYTIFSEDFGFSQQGDVLGRLICYLTQRMAFEDPSLRQFAEYLLDIKPPMGVGLMVYWSRSCLSREVIYRLNTKGYEEGIWTRWAESF